MYELVHELTCSLSYTGITADIVDEVYLNIFTGINTHQNLSAPMYRFQQKKDVPNYFVQCILIY